MRWLSLLVKTGINDRGDFFFSPVPYHPNPLAQLSGGNGSVYTASPMCPGSATPWSLPPQLFPPTVSTETSISDVLDNDHLCCP